MRTDGTGHSTASISVQIRPTGHEILQVSGPLASQAVDRVTSQVPGAGRRNITQLGMTSQQRCRGLANHQDPVIAS